MLLQSVMSNPDSDIQVGKCPTCDSVKIANFCGNCGCSKYINHVDRLAKQQQQQQLLRQKEFDALLANISAADAQIYCKYMQEKIAQ